MMQFDLDGKRSKTTEETKVTLVIRGVLLRSGPRMGCAVFSPGASAHLMVACFVRCQQAPPPDGQDDNQGLRTLSMENGGS